MNRRTYLGALVGAVTFSLAGAAFAAYPDKPVRLIVAWPAGGLVDIPARLVADKLRTALGQSIIVENRAGAGGNIGAAAVAKSAPDGNTLLVTTSAIAINKAMRQTMPFDLQHDFVPVAALSYAPLILVTHPEGPKSVAAFIRSVEILHQQASTLSSGQLLETIVREFELDRFWTDEHKR